MTLVNDADRLQYTYDKRHDVLRVYIGDYTPSYGDETVQGVYLMREPKNNRLTGLTILGFVERPIAELAESIPINLNWESIRRNALA